MINDAAGKPLNPNLDRQRAATILKLAGFDEYANELKNRRELLKEIQLLKNKKTRGHERRGDLKTGRGPLEAS